MAELWLGYTLTVASKASPGLNTLQYLRTYNKKTQKARGWLTVFSSDDLKWLSHEMDFKNFDKNLQNLA